MEVTLNGFNGFLQHHEHDEGESQLALTGEILGAHTMASDEFSIAQSLAQCFHQSEEMMGNARQRWAITSS